MTEQWFLCAPFLRLPFSGPVTIFATLSSAAERAGKPRCAATSGLEITMIKIITITNSQNNINIHSDAMNENTATAMTAIDINSSGHRN